MILRALRLPAVVLGLLMTVSTGARATIEAVLFTGGEGSSSTAFRDGLASFIGSATSTLDVAVYSMTDPTVIAAINARAAAGVTVRVVMDGENSAATDPTLNPVIIDDAGDHREMHHKFVIVDAADSSRAAVWTGSANFTVSGLTTQNNNAIIIRNSSVAAAYRAEMDRLVAGGFHTNKTNASQSFVLSDGTVITVRFSPSSGTGGTTTGLTGVINAAASSFYYAIYIFGTTTISTPMISKATLSDFGWFDRNQSSNPNFTQLDEIQATAGMTAQQSSVAIMHHKFLVADRSVVVTGSANFTASANSDNDENQVIINSSSIADLYIKEINRMTGQNLEGLGSNNPNDTTAPGFVGTAPVTVTATTNTSTGKVMAGPNPFRPGQSLITFRSDGAGDIRKIEVFDIYGNRVHSIVPTTDPGAVSWNGRNAQQGLIGSGVYFYRVESGGRIFTGRFTAVK